MKNVVHSITVPRRSLDENSCPTGEPAGSPHSGEDGAAEVGARGDLMEDLGDPLVWSFLQDEEANRFRQPDPEERQHHERGDAADHQDDAPVVGGDELSGRQAAEGGPEDEAAVRRRGQE